VRGRGDLGEDGPNRWGQPAVTVEQEAVTGHLMRGIGLEGAVMVGRRGRSGPISFFNFKFLFQFDFPSRREINGKEIIRNLRKI
jgi:hypothetical protein